jgi:hypothetical protein
LSAADREVLAAANLALAQPADVDLREASLEDLVSLVADRTGLNVVLDRKALDEAGIGVDARVTLRARGAPLSGVLELALRQLDLTWHVRHGVLLITTLDEQELSGLELRVYPVEDLVRVPIECPVASSDGGYDFDMLIDLLTTTVAPDRWDEVGGPGSVAPWPNRPALVVSQVREVHEELGRLFEALRALPRTSWPGRPPRPYAGPSDRGARPIGLPEAASVTEPDGGLVSRPHRPRALARWQLPRTYE